MPSLRQTLLASMLFSTQAVVNANPLLQLRAPACPADNCLRAVSGTTGPATKIPATQRSSDCAAFLLTTVTPATSTMTVTATQTPATSVVTTSTIYVYTTTQVVTSTTQAAVAAVLKRATTVNGAVSNSQTTIPAYISTSCGGSPTSLARYSSACSCLGLTASQTTVATPIATTTVTVTATTPLTTSYSTISTATTTTTTYVAPPAGPTCDPTPYVATDGEVYITNCNFDLSGNNGILSVTVEASFSACAERCEARGGCSALDYYRESPDSTPVGTCVLLQSSSAGGSARSGVDSVVRVT